MIAQKLASPSLMWLLPLLGSIVMRHVPVRIRDTRGFAMVAGGRRVDGILGTVALYHFISTLDYPHGALVLRPAEGGPCPARRARRWPDPASR